MIASHFFSSRNGGDQDAGTLLSTYLGVGVGFISGGRSGLRTIGGVYTIVADGSSLDTQPLNTNKQPQIINTVLNIF